MHEDRIVAADIGCQPRAQARRITVAVPIGAESVHRGCGLLDGNGRRRVQGGEFRWSPESREQGGDRAERGDRSTRGWINRGDDPQDLHATEWRVLPMPPTISL